MWTAVRGFVRRARYERQFPLPETSPMANVLAHLHLIAGAEPTHAGSNLRALLRRFVA